MTEFKRPSLDDWALRAVDELKGRDVDELVWSTPEGIDVKALYSAEDLEGLDTRSSSCPDSPPSCAARGRRCMPAGPGP